MVHSIQCTHSARLSSPPPSVPTSASFVVAALRRYGWHFPEMGKIIADNIQYAKVRSLPTQPPPPLPMYIGGLPSPRVV